MEPLSPPAGICSQFIEAEGFSSRALDCKTFLYCPNNSIHTYIADLKSEATEYLLNPKN